MTLFDFQSVEVIYEIVRRLPSLTSIRIGALTDGTIPGELPNPAQVPQLRSKPIYDAAANKKIIISLI